MSQTEKRIKEVKQAVARAESERDLLGEIWLGGDLALLYLTLSAERRSDEMAWFSPEI